MELTQVLKENGKVLVIAEAGVNHNGSLEMALRLVDAASEAGADVVKFQIFKTGSVISPNAQKAAYQRETTGSAESQADMVRKLELPFEDFRAIKARCEEREIQFLATSFDAESTRYLAEELDTPFFKVPSGEITNWPYLVQIAGYGRPVVMSTGMATTDEALAALEVLRGHGAGEVTVLHCNTQYPTPYADANLLAMPELGRACGCAFGYSDHTPGIEVPIAAVALGASVIEKHFTLDRTLPGPDQKASLEPSELAAMVRSIRNVEAALGSADKHVTESERENLAVARKSIVAARAIRAGELLSEDNLTTKRPGDGLNPMRWPEALGTKAVRDFAPDEEIEL